MRSFVYILLNLAIFVPVLLLSFGSDIKPHKHTRGLLGAYFLVSIPFLVWEAWAVRSGAWVFESAYVEAARFMGLPIGAILVLFTLPFAMIYVWGMVKKYIADRAVRAIWPLLIMAIVAGVSLAMLVIYWGQGYTRSAMLATIIAVIVTACSQFVFTLRFWVFEIAALIIVFLMNWAFSWFSIPQYAAEYSIGTRIVDVPIESIFYYMSFITLFVIVFNWVDRRSMHLRQM